MQVLLCFEALPEVLGERNPALLVQRRVPRCIAGEIWLTVTAFDRNRNGHKNRGRGHHANKNRSNEEIVHANPFSDL
jgi:hypothetical protein